VPDVRERRILDGEMGLPDGDLSTSDLIEEIENRQENAVSRLASPQKRLEDLRDEITKKMSKTPDQAEFFQLKQFFDKIDTMIGLLAEEHGLVVEVRQKLRGDYDMAVAAIRKCEREHDSLKEIEEKFKSSCRVALGLRRDIGGALQNV
jgi:chromosome segregation ATPase